MASEEQVHGAMKAWLQVTEDEQPWLRRARWAVQTRRSDEAGADGVFIVWVEINARGEQGLGEERGALAVALANARILGKPVRDLREVHSDPRRLALRLRIGS